MQEWCPQNQIERGQHNAADQTHHHRIADAPLCLGNLVLPKADADEGAAAVTDHHGNGQRYHRQGEHDGVGGVAAGAQIVPAFAIKRSDPRCYTVR